MPSNSYNHLSAQIKAEALRMGFSACGFASLQEVEPQARMSFEEWIARGKHADMGYLENYRDKRFDPRLLVDGAQTMICVALNYFPKQQLNEEQLQFASYAYGKDYHEVMKGMLNRLLEYIRTLIPHAGGRAFCDTAPILERYWACRAGLGWVGKNCQLIIPHTGSYFFLGEIILDVELGSDVPVTSRCGNCVRCLEACPTGALESSQCLDASKCLSYLTIENRGDIPEEYAAKIGNCIYGCDECLKACPWNRYATPTEISELQPSEAFLNMTKEDWDNLTVEQYHALFKGSAVKRAKYEGLKRNIELRNKKAKS